MGLGIGIGIWDFVLGIGIGDWELGLGLGLGIGDWDWGLGIGDKTLWKCAEISIKRRHHLIHCETAINSNKLPLNQVKTLRGIFVKWSQQKLN